MECEVTSTAMQIFLNVMGGILIGGAWFGLMLIVITKKARKNNA